MKKITTLSIYTCISTVCILLCIIVGIIVSVNSGKSTNVKDEEEKNIVNDEKIDLKKILKQTEKVYKNDIPQIFVTTVKNNDGVNLFTDKTKKKVDTYIIVKDTNGKNVEFNEYGTIKVRGNVTHKAAKKPYTIKFNTKADLFGMGKAKKWVLLANVFDKTLLRNQVGLDFYRELEETHNSGYQYTSKCKTVDLYIDGKYLGAYLLAEAVEVGEDRVDIDLDYLDLRHDYLSTCKEYKINGKKYKLNDVLIEIANDYRIDQRRVDMDCYYFITNKLDIIFCINEPERSEKSKYTFIAESDNKPDFVKDTAKFLNDFEKVIISDSYSSDKKQYEDIKKYIDIESFKDFYIMAELFKIQDINYSSTRFYVKNGKLYAGPLWDLDFSTGNLSHNKTYDDFFANKKMKWFKELMKNSVFKEKVIDRYKEIKPLIKELYADDGKIDKAYNQIKKAAKCNYEEAYNVSRKEKGWGYDIIYGLYQTFEGEETKYVGYDDAVYGSNDSYTEYEPYIKDSKNWLKNRDKWLSEEFGI